MAIRAECEDQLVDLNRDPGESRVLHEGGTGPSGRSAVAAPQRDQAGVSGGPDQYLPADEAFHCEYVWIWLEIEQV